jgi:pimeloyl-ACP methyl ester carboxylesterase
VTRALRVLAAALRDAGEPCLREQRAGVEVLVARPRAGAGPVVVYANAATPSGIDQPAVARLLGGLARAGAVAVAPELPCVRGGVVTPETVAALVRVVRASGPRVALLGASTGAALSILAAAELEDRVTAVAAVAPFASLEAMLRLGTTGTYAGRPYDAAPLVAEMAARSLRTCAPGDAAVEPLLANRDPARFDVLYADLAPDTRSLIARLSPLNAIVSVVAPVELACAPVDRFCPPGESHALACRGRDVRLTVTTGLAHVCPRARPGLVQVVGLVDRLLVRAAAAEPVRRLRPAPA